MLNQKKQTQNIFAKSENIRTYVQNQKNKYQNIFANQKNKNRTYLQNQKNIRIYLQNHKNKNQNIFKKSEKTIILTKSEKQIIDILQNQKTKFFTKLEKNQNYMFFKFRKYFAKSYIQKKTIIL